MKHKLYSLLGLLLLVAFIVRNPAGAADLAGNLVDGLGTLADAFGAFASNLGGAP